MRGRGDICKHFVFLRKLTQYLKLHKLGARLLLGACFEIVDLPLLLFFNLNPEKKRFWTFEVSTRQRTTTCFIVTVIYSVLIGLN